MPEATKTATDDGRRHQPVQRRSAAKVDAIVLAARAILADPDGELTVRALADEVGVSVGTVYRYFESMDAVVDAVVAQHAAAAESRIGELLAKSDCGSLAELFGLVTAEFISFYRENPQFTQLRLVGEYSHRYAEAEDRSNALLVGQLAAVAVSRGLMSSGKRAQTRLLVHWGAVGAGLRLAFSNNPAGDRAVLAEVKQMVERFALSY